VQHHDRANEKRRVNANAHRTRRDCESGYGWNHYLKELPMKSLLEDLVSAEGEISQSILASRLVGAGISIGPILTSIVLHLLIRKDLWIGDYFQ
jgi:hypothetical protein